MKAILLHIQLKLSLEHSRNKLNKVLARLPEGTEWVMHGDRLAALLIPGTDIIPKVTVRIRHFLDEFENWHAVGLSGEVFCKNGSMDPLAWALRQYSAPPAPRRKGLKPENLAFPERGKLGLKAPR